MVGRHFVLVATILIAATVTKLACGESDDASLKKLFVGTWTTDASNPANDLEREAAELGFYGTTQYKEDGTGTTEIYKERCGLLMRHHEFRWDIKDSVLITYLREGALRDRIVTLTAERASLINLTEPGQPHENRVRAIAPDCPRR